MKRSLDVAFDFHGAEHSPACVALLAAHLRDKCPDIFIFGGDVVDFGNTSRFDQVGRMGPQTILEESNITLTKIIIPVLEALGFEIKWRLRAVDPQNPALKNVEKVEIQSCVNRRKVTVKFLEGNHEMRLKRHLGAMAPSFDGLVTFDRVFCLKELDIDYIHSLGSQGNGILHLNKHLMVMHGERYGINQAKLQSDDVMGSVIAGHGHREGFSRKSSGITGNDWAGITSGCMSKAPTYKSTNSYNRGFITGFYDDAPPYRFNIHHASIIASGAHMPDDIHAYPRRVQEPDTSVLITPWAEYKAIETKAGWTASRIWSAGLPMSEKKKIRS